MELTLKQKKNAHFTKGNKVKKAYETLEIAQKAAEGVTLSMGAPFDAYQCPICNGFHIGHSMLAARWNQVLKTEVKQKLTLNNIKMKTGTIILSKKDNTMADGLIYEDHNDALAMRDLYNNYVNADAYKACPLHVQESIILGALSESLSKLVQKGLLAEFMFKNGFACRHIPPMPVQAQPIEDEVATTSKKVEPVKKSLRTLGLDWIQAQGKDVTMREVLEFLLGTSYPTLEKTVDNCNCFIHYFQKPSTNGVGSFSSLLKQNKTDKRFLLLVESGATKMESTFRLVTEAPVEKPVVKGKVRQSCKKVIPVVETKERKPYQRGKGLGRCPHDMSARGMILSTMQLKNHSLSKDEIMQIIKKVHGNKNSDFSYYFQPIGPINSKSSLFFQQQKDPRYIVPIPKPKLSSMEDRYIVIQDQKKLF